MQLGIFFTGISPSGGASNIWTILLGGNLNLSVTMTTLCTIAAFGKNTFFIFCNILFQYLLLSIIYNMQPFILRIDAYVDIYFGKTYI